VSESAVTSDFIKQQAAALQFALCGITEARPTDHAEHVRRWLDDDKHGSMAWLANNLEKRLDPMQLLDGARSVICVADDLTPGRENSKLETRNSNTGRIARYAQFNDYHKIIKKRLHQLCDVLGQRAPAHQFRACVDTAPVLEREHAHRAGLGWAGKNTMLIHPRRGSHLMLGEIITTLPLEPDKPEPDHCGSCTRCIDACPTGCIEPYSLDASRCISYQTIENRGPIDPQFDETVDDWLFGCDICQDVCPFNNPQRASGDGDQLHERYGARPAAMDLMAVLDWSPDDRIAALTRSAMKRAKLDQFKRNALLVAGNQLRKHPDQKLYNRIASLADDERESPMVRQTARRVMTRLTSRENC